jgi:hypothetical protein
MGPLKDKGRIVVVKAIKISRRTGGITPQILNIGCRWM